MGFCLFNLVGQDIRDRFSGAVEAFSRRNASSSGRHAEHSRHRSDDIPSSKDVVWPSSLIDNFVSVHMHLHAFFV